MKGTAYLIQATLISLWWIGLLISPNFYLAFQFPNINSIAFNSFLLPDLVVIALLSLYRAYKPIQSIEYIILGGFAFATLYCINATILTGGGILSTVVMTFGLFYNLFIINKTRLFRISTSSNIMVNGLKTFIQIICVWAITLFLLPTLILESFGTILRYDTVNIGVGISLLIMFSLLGLYSALFMVKNGKGTPLPVDQTQQLVTKGPYAYVRNPMAVAGIGQGISISIITGSIHLLIYTILGALVWQFVVKPIEEKNMLHRFGDQYELYKQRVNCWIPKMK